MTVLFRKSSSFVIYIKMYYSFINGEEALLMAMAFYAQVFS